MKTGAQGAIYRDLPKVTQLGSGSAGSQNPLKDNTTIPAECDVLIPSTQSLRPCSVSDAEVDGEDAKTQKQTSHYSITVKFTDLANFKRGITVTRYRIAQGREHLMLSGLLGGGDSLSCIGHFLGGQEGVKPLQAEQ